MQFKNNRGRFGSEPGKGATRPRSWLPIAACFLALAVVGGGAQTGQQPSPGAPAAVPSAGVQVQGRGGQVGQQKGVADSVERRNQLAEDSAKLLKLATDLKAEVDKTNKDMLSITVIRKAEAIQRLAHNVKERTKLTAGGS